MIERWCHVQSDAIDIHSAHMKTTTKETIRCGKLCSITVTNTQLQITARYHYLKSDTFFSGPPFWNVSENAPNAINLIIAFASLSAAEGV